MFAPKMNHVMIKGNKCYYHSEQQAEKKCHRCNRLICSYDIMSAYHIFDVKRLSQIAIKEPRTNPPRAMFTDDIFSVAHPVNQYTDQYTLSPSYFCPICYYILMKDQVKNGVGSQIAVLFIFLLPFIAIFLYMFSIFDSIFNAQPSSQVMNIGDILFDFVKIFVGIFVTIIFVVFIGYIFKQWSLNKARTTELNDLKENFIQSTNDKNLITAFENNIISCNDCGSILAPSESFCMNCTPSRETINLSSN